MACSSTTGLHIGRELTGNERADGYVTHGRVDTHNVDAPCKHGITPNI